MLMTLGNLRVCVTKKNINYIIQRKYYHPQLLSCGNFQHKKPLLLYLANFTDMKEHAYIGMRSNNSMQ